MRLKRSLDLILAFFLLMALSPIFLTLSLLIFLSNPSAPIFYLHRRLGRGKTPFFCYKFRTMLPNAEEQLERLLQCDPRARYEWETYHKLSHDPRLTRLGAFLRKSSLDELPQLWNVLRGELSLVGPRPVTEQEIIRHFGEKGDKILSIAPGLTGLWQVYGRHLDLAYAERVAMEEFYVDHRSLWLDVKILCYTLPALFRQRKRC